MVDQPSKREPQQQSAQQQSQNQRFLAVRPDPPSGPRQVEGTQPWKPVPIKDGQRILDATGPAPSGGRRDPRVSGS
jgi:hypothetical protein